MGTATEQFLDALCRQGRVLMLGGLAVIAHGLARATKDIDIWFEPFGSSQDWASRVSTALSDFAGAGLYDLRNHRPAPTTDLPELIDRDGVVRVTGLERPIDIFRTPHNILAQDFDEVWNRALAHFPSARVPDDIDLLVTKEGTSRAQDIADVSFLETKIRARLCEILARCPFEEASAILARYADHAVCRAALANPDRMVRDLAVRLLREFAESGDPFAEEILAEHQ